MQVKPSAKRHFLDRIYGPSFEVRYDNGTEVDYVVEHGHPHRTRTFTGIRTAIIASARDFEFPGTIVYHFNQLDVIAGTLQMRGDQSIFDTDLTKRLHATAAIIEAAIHPRIDSHFDDLPVHAGTSTQLPPASGE